jgi:hypothetical protein
MTENKTTQNEEAVLTAEEIIDDIISWTDVQEIKEHLSEMMVAYLMFNEEAEPETKQKIHLTYTLLQDSLTKIKLLAQQEDKELLEMYLPTHAQNAKQTEVQYQ